MLFLLLASWLFTQQVSEQELEWNVAFLINISISYHPSVDYERFVGFANRVYVCTNTRDRSRVDVLFAWRNHWESRILQGIALRREEFRERSCECAFWNIELQRQSCCLFCCYLFQERSQHGEKATVSFVISVRSSVSPSSWNDSVPTARVFLKFEHFSKICRENSSFIKIWQG